MRLLDRLAGLVLGLVAGVFLCWAIGAVLLYLPGETDLRREVQRSAILGEINDVVPPERLLEELERVDPIGVFLGPPAIVAPPDEGLATDPDVVRASKSVVRVTGIACGLGVQGSGWVAGDGLVVTNAHVVAGIESPFVDRGDGRTSRARVVSFDARNDVAVLHLPGLRGRALAFGDPKRGQAAALLGFPGNGPFRVTAVRMGRTAKVGARDAYGRLELGRPIVALRGNVRSGNSGGPIVDDNGQVLGTVFAARRGSDDGFAVPNEQVRNAVANVGPALATACVGR